MRSEWVKEKNAAESVQQAKQEMERLRFEAEKAERIKLQALLQQCKAENDSCRKQIGDLEQKVNNLQLSEAFGVGGDKVAAKERIEKLIKEIDKCISLLEN